MNYKLFNLNRFFVYLVFIGFLPILHAQNAPNVWDVLRSEFSISHEVSRAEVQEQIRWIVSHPSYIHKVCRQSEPYIYHIVGELKKRKLPGELALVPMIESAYDPFAYSGVGAAGLWQLMPRTGSDLGLKQDWWFDARRSIGPSTDAALNYLRYLNKFFNGNWILAIAAYDAGEGAISRIIKSSSNPRRPVNFWNLPVPRETKLYVPRLLALAEVISNPERYKVSLPHIPYLPYFEEVNIGTQIDLNHAAKLAGISYKELIKLNPGYNRWATAPYKPFKLLIPTEKVHQFYTNLSYVPPDQRVSWTKHKVKNGDNLNNIANRYHTTVNLIKQLNQLTNNNLKPNQSILIPSTKNTPLLAKKEVERPEPKFHKIPLGKTHRVIHIVQGSDSYQKIARTYNISIKDIELWNKIQQHKALYPGQQLVIWKKVKQPKHYVVQKGDSLGLIARMNQLNVNTLIQMNPQLQRKRAIHPGQKLLVG